MKKKLLFVIQRYGEDVHGGAEWECRQIAERLTDKFNVEVATTKARSYVTWANYYKKDEEELNGVLIRRFSNDRERAKDFSKTEKELVTDIKSLKLNLDWLNKQGPYSTPFKKFLQQNYHKYHKIIIYQYLYTISYHAMKIVPASKIIFVPLAHDEPFIKFPIFRENFRKPNTIVFNTKIERKLVLQTHYIQDKKYIIAAAGIEKAEVNKSEIKNFCKKYGLDKYIIFLGRIDPAKRVDILIKNFIKYKKKYPSNLKLLLVGREVFKVEKNKDVVKTGFISEKEKYAAIAGSLALVNPSVFESLSLIVLEAFLMKKPVIVNGFCEVLKYHCLQSSGGLWYENELEFEEILNYILKNPKISKKMGENGYKYVKKNYTWDVIMQKWYKILNLE